MKHHDYLHAQRRQKINAYISPYSLPNPECGECLRIAFNLSTPGEIIFILSTPSVTVPKALPGRPTKLPASPRGNADGVHNAAFNLRRSEDLHDMTGLMAAFGSTLTNLEQAAAVNDRLNEKYKNTRSKGIGGSSNTGNAKYAKAVEEAEFSSLRNGTESFSWDRNAEAALRSTNRGNDNDSQLADASRAFERRIMRADRRKQLLGKLRDEITERQRVLGDR
jgi:hypothetical protein